ncbi:hypothetical protein GYH30_031463 [Glycine max]|nr:hypothetical protein GYH30_031463 [Glycine max]
MQIFHLKGTMLHHWPDPLYIAMESMVSMYNEAKLTFFIFLWYPKTKGTTYVCDSFRPGDFDVNSKRDIIVETQHGQLQRIHELHSSYLVLQYPILFSYGEDGKIINFGSGYA